MGRLTAPTSWPDGGLPGGPAVRVTGLTKRFGGELAVHDVSLSFEAGKVYGLVGQNGAGKSTLVRMIAGAVAPDAGQIEVDGVPHSFSSPRDALASGITIVAQDPTLVPSLTVAENVALGRLPATLGLVDRPAIATLFEKVNAQAGFELNPRARAGDLPIAGRQQVEILRAIAGHKKLVVFDEPTSSLSVQEAERLHEIIRRLADSDVAVVLVSHFLEEILEHSSIVAVMRNGMIVETGLASDATSATLVRAMVGHEVDLKSSVTRAPRPAGDVPILEVRDLIADWVGPVSMKLRAGEIVGLVGLVGAGRSEFLRAIAGVRRPDAGLVIVNGTPTYPRSVRTMRDQGVVYLPEDRKEDGLFMNQPVDENIAAGLWSQFARAGWSLRSRQRQATVGAAEQALVKAQSLQQPISSLSGGNQQKSMMARGLLADPPVLLVDEPTRGVDVVSIDQIHRVLAARADRGTGILLATSEFDEAMAIANRLIVFRKGRVVSEYPAGKVDKATLLHDAFGAGRGTAA